MPTDHVSNTDYHDFLEGIPTNECFIDYEALKLQKINLQHRCASYRTGLELTLKWLKANTNAHPATTISNLAEDSVWAKLRLKEKDSLDPKNNAK